MASLSEKKSSSSKYELNKSEKDFLKELTHRGMYMKKYTQDHEWVEIDGDVAVVGISKHAAEELGDITFVELPEHELDVIVGDVLAVVESVKAASDIYAPISGEVGAVNEDLEAQPELINEDPYEAGWIYKM